MQSHTTTSSMRDTSQSSTGTSRWMRLKRWWNEVSNITPKMRRKDGARMVKVWDQRSTSFRTVNLNDPDDPMWLTAYHIHAVGKGMQTGPAY